LWHIRKSDSGPYRLRDFTRAFGQWIVGDLTTGQIGRLDESVMTEYGLPILREFSTPLGFGDGRGFIVHEVALYGLPGRVQVGVSPQISLSVSRNGITYSQERWTAAGKRGDFDEIPKWRRIGRANSQMSMRFRVANESLFTPSRLEITVEPLNA
jgi:hypothetical protein